MEIKGSAVKATPDFVKYRFGLRYSEWVKSLPETSRAIIEQPNLCNCLVFFDRFRYYSYTKGC